MSEQIQHSLLNIEIKELKTLLFDGEKRSELLNKQLRIYLAVNEKAQTIAYRHKAYAVITIDLHFGARAYYYDYNQARLAKKYASPEIILQTEQVRKDFENKHDSIIQEEWQRKESILSSIIGPRRALKLERPPRVDDYFYNDRYTSFPVTTVEERESLSHLGIEIGIFQEISK